MNLIAHYFGTLGIAKKSYARRLEPLCKKWGLTRSELDVLLFLHNNPDSDRSVDIVERRGIAKSHVSLSVSALESRGLLRRRFEPADRRTAHLELTENGQAIAREGRLVQQEFFAQIYGALTPEEFALWQQLSQKIAENIGNLEG